LDVLFNSLSFLQKMVDWRIFKKEIEVFASNIEYRKNYITSSLFTREYIPKNSSSSLDQSSKSESKESEKLTEVTQIEEKLLDYQSEENIDSRIQSKNRILALLQDPEVKYKGKDS
jgi:hypothetical protein